MPKTAPVYSTEKSAQLGEILKKMAANPKGLLLRDVVQANKSKIQSALEAGYSYDDIITAFKHLEITIRPTTLKQYLRDPNASRSDGRSKRSKPKPSPEPPTTVEISTVEDQQSVDPSPAAQPVNDKPADLTNSPPTMTRSRRFQPMRSLDEL